jgi:hypothetical protein
MIVKQSQAIIKREPKRAKPQAYHLPSETKTPTKLGITIMSTNKLRFENDFSLWLCIFLFKDLDLEYKKQRHPSETLTRNLELIHGENDEKTTGSKQ